MLPKDITEDVIKRIKTVKGQLGGIEKMLDDGKDPNQIINQFKAAEEALNKAHILLLDEVFRKGLALQLADVMNACPGNCQDAEQIAFLKKKFPQLELDEITNKMQEVKEINERMIKNNVKPKE
ncbi:MAG: metal-sensitive transcriptional regulator [Segetibacter sp.]|jgi:DNA-binding FrmR family transcriptional regulator